MRKHEKFIQIDIKVQVKDTTSKKEQNIQTNNKDTTTGRIEEYIMRDMTARRSGAQRHLKKEETFILRVVSSPSPLRLSPLQMQRLRP